MRRVKLSRTSVFRASFPVGTKLVVEDRGIGGAHAYARYLVFPDGRRMDVPTAASAPAVKPLRRRRSPSALRRHAGFLRRCDRDEHGRD